MKFYDNQGITHDSFIESKLSSLLNKVNHVNDKNMMSWLKERFPNVYKHMGNMTEEFDEEYQEDDSCFVIDETDDVEHINQNIITAKFQSIEDNLNING